MTSDIGSIDNILGNESKWVLKQMDNKKIKKRNILSFFMHFFVLVYHTKYKKTKNYI